ncbi:MAG TPA: sorbosone dehydrogenase family protein [Verrucomicrobiae bacterium]
MKTFRSLVAVVLAFTFILSIGACGMQGRMAGKMPVRATDDKINSIKLPPGFQLTVYADKLDNARSIALSPGGILYVGTRKDDKVYAVIDADKNGAAEKHFTVIEKLKMPNGVALRDGALYVAELNRILKFPDIDQTYDKSPTPQIISTNFPSDEHHGWKFIRFGPDGKLYVPVGAPCNVCLSTNPMHAAITRLNPDGSEHEVFAHGIRNTVGFDWHPQTKVLWFTENGRDEMGDEIPHDELNHAPEKDLHFGFPYIHAKGIPDPEFKAPTDKKFQEPDLLLAPHTAALGMRFYTGTMFPEKYRGGVFIAEHGSWNRKTPIGYRVMFVKFENDKPISYEVFAEGWLDGSFAWGRPVDVEIMPDGSLLVSDDKAGKIYRITYKAP